MNRPFDNRSTVAADFASSIGFRYGTTARYVSSCIRSVTAAACAERDERVERLVPAVGQPARAGHRVLGEREALPARGLRGGGQLGHGPGLEHVAVRADRLGVLVHEAHARHPSWGLSGGGRRRRCRDPVLWTFMSSTLPDVNARIASRVRELRADRGYSLDALAARSGVSRSAISTIERGEASPTAVVLEKLATGLAVPLASLFDPPAATESPSPVARRAEQLRWRDPESGYVRRNVSPAGWPSPIRIVEVEFPPGAAVSYETAERDVEIHQQVWVQTGRIEVTRGDATHELQPGDCLAMRVDQPITFRNRTAKPARYAVVLVTEPVATRRSS